MDMKDGRKVGRQAGRRDGWMKDATPINNVNIHIATCMSHASDDTR